MKTLLFFIVALTSITTSFACDSNITGVYVCKNEQDNTETFLKLKVDSERAYFLSSNNINARNGLPYNRDRRGEDDRGTSISYYTVKASCEGSVLKYELSEDVEDMRYEDVLLKYETVTRFTPLGNSIKMTSTIKFWVTDFDGQVIQEPKVTDSNIVCTRKAE